MALMMGWSKLSQVVAREVNINDRSIEVKKLRKKVEIFRVQIFFSQV